MERVENKEKYVINSEEEEMLDGLENSPFYQMLREKERLIQNYKFKYETTLLLYNELVEGLKAQHSIQNLKDNFLRVIEEVMQIFVGVTREILSSDKLTSTLERMNRKVDTIMEGTLKSSLNSSRFIRQFSGLLIKDSSSSIVEELEEDFKCKYSFKSKEFPIANKSVNIGLLKSDKYSEVPSQKTSQETIEKSFVNQGIMYQNNSGLRIDSICNISLKKFRANR